MQVGASATHAKYAGAHLNDWLPTAFSRHRPLARASWPACLEEDILGHWTFLTPKGIFVVAECASKGVDVFFDRDYIGHYKSPVEAAQAVASGNHPALLCAPEDGKSLGVPPAVHDWTFAHT